MTIFDILQLAFVASVAVVLVFGFMKLFDYFDKD